MKTPSHGCEFNLGLSKGSEMNPNLGHKSESTYSAWVLFKPTQDQEFGTSTRVGTGMSYNKAIALAKTEMLQMGEQAIGFCASLERTDNHMDTIINP